MSMDFIKILSDVITEQVNVSAGAVQGANAASSNTSSSCPWETVPSHSWSNTKFELPIKGNTNKCNNFAQRRYIGCPDEYVHNACDVSVNKGSSLRAPYDGVVTDYSNRKCGNGLQITGDDNGKKLISTFCHLRYQEVFDQCTTPPCVVSKGEVIAYTGGDSSEEGSGRSSAPHMHWSFTVDGVPTNPYTYN